MLDDVRSTPRFGGAFAATGTGDRPLVTVLGGSGFIGSAVVSALARLPVRLRAVSRGGVSEPPGAVADVQVCRADLADPAAVGPAVAGSDAVVHLAAHMPDGRSWRNPGEESRRLNVGLMTDLVAALDGRGGDGPPPVVVFASTLVAEAQNADLEESYLQQKIHAEQVLLRATADGAVRGVSIRPTTVYGRSPLTGSTGKGVISAIAAKAVAGEEITMWHDGSVVRDFMHIRDAADAFAAALDHADALAGRTWAVATGRHERLGDVFTAIAAAAAELTGAEPVPVVTVAPPEYVSGYDFQNHVVAGSEFASVTGWRPRVPLTDGLREVVGAVAGR